MEILRKSWGVPLSKVCLWLLLPAVVTAAVQLPPEIQADRYLLQAERLIAEKNHKAALEVMNKIVSLQKTHDLTLPEEFHFKYAQVALLAGSVKVAVDSLNKYLAAAGRAGKFYREALELLDEAEREEARRQIRPILPEMVVIPAGRFRMGCVSGIDCDDDEQPVHEVRIASFALSKYEVTFEEYDRFTNATGRARVGDVGWGRGRRPVIKVSWEDAVAYTKWLSAKTGEGYRLPMEAEWEYAVRAGSTTKYHFGNDESQLCRYANHADTSTDYNWRNKKCSDGVGKKTAVVGSYQPNTFGLHDMHGNVWEWVEDCWNDSYQGAPTDGSAWESGDCSRRVLRGGAWNDGSGFGFLRAANRNRNGTGLRYNKNGVRVARTLD